MSVNATNGFSAAEIAAVGNSTLDEYFNKGKLPIDQYVQEKPLVRIMEGSKKTFKGGKEYISIAIKGAYGNDGVNDTLKGFSHDDTVSFYNPNKLTRANYTWPQHHVGIEVTEHELKAQGILVTDGIGRSPGSAKAAAAILVPMWELKVKDLTEQWMVGLNNLLWDDGTMDSTALSGIRSIIADNPESGIVGGINRATAANAYWRNRAYTATYYAANAATPHGGNKITSSASNGGALCQVMQKEWRQLRRYGAKPNRILAGSDWIGAMETEMRANGYYSDSGWTGRQDASMGELYFKGVPVEYDPSLDDLGREKFAYVWDDRQIFLDVLEGDWMRPRTPARPHNQFIFHRSLMGTGQLVASQCNGAGVYEIA